MLFRAGTAGDQRDMTIPTESDPRRGFSHPEFDTRRRISFERSTVHHARRFLEDARTDARRANIVIQLAESIGDPIDSLSGYIDMLLAIFASLVRCTELDGGSRIAGRSASEHDRYLGWFAELGLLERSL